jgi:hypothetical protein
VRRLGLVAAAGWLVGCVSTEVNSPAANPAVPGGQIGGQDYGLVGKQLDDVLRVHGPPVNIQGLPDGRMAWQFRPGPPPSRPAASDGITTITRAEGPPRLYEGCFITYITAGDGGGTRPILEVRLPRPSDC